MSFVVLYQNYKEMISKEVKLSSEFKVHTTKAITAIVIFVLVYILILLFSLAITALCVYGGIMIAITITNLFGIALGIGLGSLGFFILFFLLKFLLKSNKMDRSHLIEITRKDESELFQLIDEIVKQVGTSFPKKIYLSPDVNASVFYDSSFWSMFFPVKKNLQIGLGLVNTIHKQELKAILAHEFGHFSQKTMKVGSYVYNVNHVIFNMLYDNDSYNKVTNDWANSSGYFSIFIAIASVIVEGIKWMLQIMYNLVNKNYLALSREMEFHADEIASNITGYKPLKSSLLRMPLADHSFNSVLSFYEGKISENQTSKNVYKKQQYLMNFLAKQDELSILNGLPEISLEELNKFNKSKLVIKDQWTSHPSTEERINRLEATEIKTNHTATTLANDLFYDIDKTQELLTRQLFKEVTYEATPTTMSLEDFKSECKKEYTKNTFSKVFNGYYDDKNPIPFDIDKNINQSTEKTSTMLFSNSKINMLYHAIALENDIEGIKRIAYKTLKVRTFDYGGKKYKQKESNALIIKLQKELEKIIEEIKKNDIDIFNFFISIEKKLNNTGQLKESYQKFFKIHKEYDHHMGVFQNLSEKLQFVQFTTPFEQITSNFRDILPLEKELKTLIKNLLNNFRDSSEINKATRDNFEAYLSSSTLVYFRNEKYHDENLKVLFTALNDYGYFLSRNYFLYKKELLDYKATILNQLI